MNPYELVQSEAAHFPVQALCDAVGLSRSAFYAHRRRAPSKRKREDERLLTEIRALHALALGVHACERSLAHAGLSSASIGWLA